MSESRKIKDTLAIMDGCCSTGYNLEDFLHHEKFFEVSVPLLNNSIPIRHGHDYGATRLVKRSDKYEDHLFEIILKSAIDYFKSEPRGKNRNITLYKAILTHEAAHILEGSFEPINLEDIFRNECGNEELARHIFNIQEDYRIEINLTTKMNYREDLGDCLDFLNLALIGVNGNFKGDDFQNTMSTWLRKVKVRAELSDIMTNTPNAFSRNDHYTSIEEIIADEKEFYSKETCEELQNEGIYTFKNLIDTLTKKTLDLKLKPVTDSVKILPEIYRLITTQFKHEADNYTGDGDGDEGEGNCENPLGNDNFKQGGYKPSSIKDLEEHEKEINAQVKRIAGKLSSEYAKQSDLSERINSNVDEKDDQVESEIIYEYNSSKEKVKPSRVDYKRLGSGNSDFIKEIRSKYPGLIRKITEQFQELEINQVQKDCWQRTPQVFNPIGLIYANMDDAIASEGRIFDRLKINSRDYAIYYLIDASGSTHSRVNNGSDSVLDVEKKATGAIFTAVDDLELEGNFTQKILLYDSDSPERNTTTIYEAENVSSLTQINSGANNRDGAAIRALTSRLEEEPNENKILFLLADGMPAASDYEAGVYDTSMAIKEATDKGIAVFYFLTKSSAYMGQGEISSYRDITKFATDSQVIHDATTIASAISNVIKGYVINES
jgi:hypothetical protein